MMVKGGDDGVVVVGSFTVIVALGPLVLPAIRFSSAKRASSCFVQKGTKEILTTRMLFLKRWKFRVWKRVKMYPLCCS